MRLRATKIGGISSPDAGYCPRMNAVIAYAKTNGIALPPRSELNAINAFLRDSKAMLDKLDLLYLLDGAGSAAFRMINLVNPSKYYAATLGGSAFTNNAYFGNGINAYINTGFNPALLVDGQKYQLNDACRGVLVYQESTNTTVLQCVLDGNTASVENTLFGGTLSNSQKINSGGGSNGVTASLIGVGIKMIIRYNSTGLYLIDNNKTNTFTLTSNNLPNGNQLILSRYNAGSGIYGTAGIAAYFNGGSITYGESQALKTQFNKRRVDIGLAAIA
jgi:hypothetical protein